jgi:hypothetical protein
MSQNKPTPWMGVIERVNIYGIMLWVIVLAFCLLRRRYVDASNG